MRTRLKAVFILGLGLFLSACGGSDGGSGGANLGREQAAAAPLTCSGTEDVQCPQGYHCVDDPADTCDPASGARCSGICVLGDELPPCGGVAEVRCPAGSVCAPDPNNACAADPAADCPGVCRPQADGQCTTDADCPLLDVPCSTCADGFESCPYAHCDTGQCFIDFKPCPEPQPCGGISGASCPPGFECVDDAADDCDPNGGGADCGGICRPAKEPLRCGGIGGASCSAGYECVDDAGDTCEPQNGDTDCPGTCAPGSAGECKTDAECPPLRAPCSVCSDGTEACPRSFCDGGHCSAVFPTCAGRVVCGAEGDDCKPGDVCVDDPNDDCDPSTGAKCPGLCIDDPSQYPCTDPSAAKCPPGYECADATGVCEPAAPQCRSDEECPQMLVACSQCADGSYACPHAACLDGLCTVTLPGCSGPKFCGGIAGFPCPQGFTCIDDPADDCDPKRGGADCGGLCVREEQPQSCGGFTGKPCPEGYTCADDPRDDCDPSTGGADCPGVCQPEPGRQCTSDADCPAIGAPCVLCADGSAACPRSFCGDGTCRAEFQTCGTEPADRL